MSLVELLPFLSMDYFLWQIIHTSDDIKDMSSSVLCNKLAFQGVEFKAFTQLCETEHQGEPQGSGGLARIKNSRCTQIAE
ncbi:hypothetical protein MCOR25_007244 [Pyricularia grisea]|nr:hypothetical protein MCOR25_007244 [Pyricularia grisea]